MKTIEQALPPGKWRLGLAREVISGYEISAVALKGLRGHLLPIRKASAEEFFERHPKDERGEPADTPVNLRGTPSLWLNKGPMLYLWPAPSADWIIEVTLRERGDA